MITSGRRFTLPFSGPPSAFWDYSGLARRSIAIVLSLALAALICLIGGRPASAQDNVVLLRPVAMSYTQSIDPDRNFSAETRTTVSQTQFRTYLAYDLSSVANLSTIVAASLQVAVTTSTATSPALTIKQAGAEWSPASLTYRNQPATTSAVLNPGDNVTPSAGTSINVPIALTSVKLASRISLAIGYTQVNTSIQLPKADPPTLRLVVRTPDPVEPAADPNSLPYKAAAINTSGPKVFAHYFPPYPVSLDNRDPSTDYYTRHYLNPEGENGKFRAVGGLLRDRPIGRKPVAGDYQLTDAVSEVRQAASSGIDGFTVNIMGWSGANWDRSLRIAKAASQSGTGFKSIPNIDLSGVAGNTSVATIAERLNTFYAESSAYRLPDGRYVLSSFKAEGQSPAWWANVATALEQTYGKKIALITVFLDLTDARIESYRSVSYAMSIWGLRTAESVRISPDKAGKVHSAGMKWMAPIAIQDVRHHFMKYAESGNTETLRSSWTRALSDESDMVQLITWNDYSESTQFAPSQGHGTAYLDLNGYFVAQFKKGQAPAMSGDQVMVTHRIQGFAKQPSAQSGVMDWTLSGKGTPPRDTVEAVTMLKASATVTVRAGGKTTTYTAPAGLSTRVVELSRGQISASVARGTTAVVSVTSPNLVSSYPVRWDLQYYAATSRIQ